jgi:hypothetical protein
MVLLRKLPVFMKFLSPHPRPQCSKSCRKPPVPLDEAERLRLWPLFQAAVAQHKAEVAAARKKEKAEATAAKRAEKAEVAAVKRKEKAEAAAAKRKEKAEMAVAKPRRRKATVPSEPGASVPHPLCARR